MKQIKEIEKMAQEYANTKQPANDFDYERKISRVDYTAGYLQCQEDINKITSEGFNEYIDKRNEDEKSMHPWNPELHAYQAGKFSLLKENDELKRFIKHHQDNEGIHLETIRELEEYVKFLRVRQDSVFFKGVKSKYDQAVKDIIKLSERIKFMSGDTDWVKEILDRHKLDKE